MPHGIWDVRDSLFKSVSHTYAAATRLCWALCFPPAPCCCVCLWGGVPWVVAPCCWCFGLASCGVGSRLDGLLHACETLNMQRRFGTWDSAGHLMGHDIHTYITRMGGPFRLWKSSNLQWDGLHIITALEACVFSHGTVEVRCSGVLWKRVTSHGSSLFANVLEALGSLDFGRLLRTKGSEPPRIACQDPPTSPSTQTLAQ